VAVVASLEEEERALVCVGADAAGSLATSATTTTSPVSVGRRRRREKGAALDDDDEGAERTLPAAAAAVTWRGNPSYNDDDQTRDGAISPCASLRDHWSVAIVSSSTNNGGHCVSPIFHVMASK